MSFKPDSSKETWQVARQKSNKLSKESTSLVIPDLSSLTYLDSDPKKNDVSQSLVSTKWDNLYKKTQAP